MGTIKRDRPELTDVVSDERHEQTVPVRTIVTAALTRSEADPVGYDPYDNPPPVVDLRDPA